MRSAGYGLIIALPRFKFIIYNGRFTDLFKYSKAFGRLRPSGDCSRMMAQYTAWPRDVARAKTPLNRRRERDALRGGEGLRLAASPNLTALYY